MQLDGMSCPLMDKDYMDEDGKLKAHPYLPLAQAYIPYQRYTQPMSPTEGLQKGTIWSDLVRPYMKEAGK